MIKSGIQISNISIRQTKWGKFAFFFRNDENENELGYETSKCNELLRIKKMQSNYSNRSIYGNRYNKRHHGRQFFYKKKLEIRNT